MSIFKKSLLLILVSLLAASCARKHELNPNQASESYIVVLKSSQVAAASAKLSAANANVSISSKAVVANLLAEISQEHELPEARMVFSKVLEGGVYDMTGDEAAELSLNPNVAYIEKDQIVSINATTQANATWGLDRLDQSSLPLNQTYKYEGNGAGVNVYVIDTGVRISHEQFGGRAEHGGDFVDNDSDASDCNGHGTHVAGTIAGSTYGVAKGAKIYGVRVLDCEGSGTISGVIAGVEWVTAQHKKPAVANMSLGGGASQALDDAVKASIKAGVTYAVAAGNSNVSACNSSPARVSDAITVGSSTSSDARSDFSNYGTCVSVFAPGSDITSAWYNSNSATKKISGTSMASPHVAGVAALYLASNTNSTPAQVKAALLAGSVSGKISDVKGSPNLLINTAFLAPSQPPPPPPPANNQLQNGVALNNVTSDSKNEEKAYTVEVPANSKNLSISLSGGRGDADLYVKFGSKPTSSSYDCRPYKNGNSETCNVSSPRAGTYHVVIKTYAPYSGVSLKATFQKK
jgi:serine protease